MSEPLAAPAPLASATPARPLRSLPSAATPKPGLVTTADEAIAAGHGRFVIGFLGSFVSVLAGVLAFNVVVDPFALSGTGIVPTAVEPDRSIKLDLVQHLKRSPQILILGDSRGRSAEPAFLQGLTGHSGFNAAVTGGSAPDAYVFVRYVADRFPHQRRRYIWFTSVGLASGTVLPAAGAGPARSPLPARRPSLRPRRRRDVPGHGCDENLVARLPGSACSAPAARASTTAQTDR